MKIKNIILTMTLMGCSTLAFGQTVEQRMDSLQLLIGQQTILHLKATARKGARIVLPSFKPQDQIVPGVEVVEQSKGDTMQMGDDRIQVSRDYTLTSFDEKVYVVPALDVKIDGKSYHGNPLALKVLTVPVDTVHPNQFYPAKGVQDNPFEWSEWSFAFWLSLLMIIICGAMIYLRNRLKKNKPIIARIRIVKRVPAHEKALREINDIKHHHTSASQETQKEYYTQLTNTLRAYIVSRFGFNAMEMTSGEIIERLRASGDQKMIDELRMLFSTADLVKFAKYEIPMNENDANLVNAINFIDQTKTDEQPKEEKIVPTLSTEDQKSQQQRRLIKTLLWVGGISVVAIFGYVVYQVAMLVM
ncbi:hypothetical protein [Segatella copri]|uniref:hypothetical protein n=1 Tax=Segatella copri TaxID=165179 RepID=UPI00294B6CC4|nr:hypothetical protein [Segatella copri]